MSITTRIPAQRDIDGMAVIGRTRHALMGIRSVEGEQSAPPAAPAAPASPATPPAETEAPWTKDNFDPDRAWKRIENMQKDHEEYKAKQETALAAAVAEAAAKAQKDTLAQFGRLLSGQEEPETDPVKLQEKVTSLGTQVAEANTNLTKAQADIKTRDISLAVALVAPELGANTKLLLANEQFKTSIASVEPTDEAEIKKLITKAVQDTPTLKATSPRSGSGEHQGATVQTLEAQLAAAQKAGDLTETIRLKRAIAAAKA